MAKNLRTNIYEGGLTVDPSAGAGVAAPVGAVLIRMGTPEIWQKFGAVATDWRRIDLTDGDKGDITVSANGTTWTIDPAAVTLAKMANLPAASVIGSVAGGVPAALTGTQVTSLLDVFGALKGLVPPSPGGTTTFLRADATFNAPASSAGWFGTGFDGAVTMGAGTTTLARTMQYTTLAVPNGATVATDGYPILATTSVTVDAGGVISADGNNASGATQGNATAGFSSGTRVFGGGSAGGAGGTGVGNVGGVLGNQLNELPTTGATSGRGGTGGAGVSGGGAGGLVQLHAGNGVNDGSGLFFPWFLIGAFPYTSTRYNGGSGGGAGGGGGVGNTSGGGGGGAAMVTISAPVITNNGTIRAIGGNGGNGAGVNTGGGGTGGGGKAHIMAKTYTGTAPDVSAGATPGNGSGGGANGGIGSTGNAIVVQGV